MSKEAMLTAEVAVLTELVRVLSDKVNELEAKQEQGEPVAVMELHAGGWDLVEDIDTDWLETLPFGTKLYTTPQQHTWVGLTDEQFQVIRNSLSRQEGWDGDGWDLALKEAIESKLKEKNT